MVRRRELRALRRKIGRLDGDEVLDEHVAVRLRRQAAHCVTDAQLDRPHDRRRVNLKAIPHQQQHHTSGNHRTS